MQVHLRKSAWARDSVEYLGYVIDRTGIRPQKNDSRDDGFSSTEEPKGSTRIHRNGKLLQKYVAKTEFDLGTVNGHYR